MRCWKTCLTGIILVCGRLTPCDAQQEFRKKADSLVTLIRGANNTVASIHFQTLAMIWMTPDAVKSVAYTDSAVSRALRTSNAELTGEAWLKKGSVLRQLNEYRQAQEAIKKALALLPQTSKARADAYLENGITLLRLAAYDSALITLRLGQATLKHHPDTSMEAALYNVMGNVFREKSMYQEALENYLKSAELFEHIDQATGLTQALSNLGNIHNLMDHPDKALAYAQKSLEVAQQANVKSSVAYAYRLMGRIYRKQKNTAEALVVYTRAVAIYKDLSARQDLGETLLSMANIYYDQQQYKLAVNHYHESIAALSRLEDSSLITYAYAGLGYALQAEHNYGKALLYFDTTLQQAERMKILPLQMDAYQMRSIIYEKTGNYKASLSNYQLYSSIRDTLAGIQNRKAAAELEARYQTEKKDQAIRLLEAENLLKAEQLQVRNNFRNFLIILLLLSIVIIAVTYNQYRIKSRANKKLKELDELKSRLFTDLSHEFRTPLSLILGPLQEQLQSVSNATHEKEMLTMMYRNAKRMQGLVDEVLDLARLEAGTLPLMIQMKELVGFLKLVTSAFTGIAEQRNIQFIVEIMEQPIMGCIDPEKLQKIVCNLLSNAFKFTATGGSVYVRAHVSQGTLFLEVQDTGRGVAADKLDLIFKRFYRTAETNANTTEGTGIGLALTRELVELHRGTITVKSIQGKGSTFSLMIPILAEAYVDVSYPPALVSTDSEERTPMLYGEQTDLHPERKPVILIAEDNLDMQDFISQLLSNQYEVITATDGSNAWQIIQSHIPDLVITDWMMPNMTGLSLCEQLKSSDATCHIPVLMLTARADQTDKLEGLETGADDYLMKPFDPKELQVRVNNLIEQRIRLRRAFSTQLLLKPSEILLPSRDATFITGVMQFLETNYGDATLSVDSFAATFSMSRMQLHRKLKALTDQSPGDFIRQFRLERAKQLFIVQGIQVSEVCFKVGFSNVANFSKAFREYTGQTPTDYIKSQLAVTHSD